MSVTAESMLAWCQTLLDVDGRGRKRTLADYLAAFPGLRSLADLPSGTPVLVRGDVDAKPGAKIGDGDIRLRSMIETLEFGRAARLEANHLRPHRPQARRDRWPRSPSGSAKCCSCDVPLIDDWLDEATMTIRDRGRRSDSRQPRPAACCCWKTRAATTSNACCGRPSRPICRKLAEPLARFANEFAEKIAHASTSTKHSRPAASTASSTIVPAAMDRVALGNYVAARIRRPDAALPGRAAGRLQRPEDRQARRPGSDDRPRHDADGVHRRLAGHGAEEGRRRARRQARSRWAWPKIRRTATSRITFRRERIEQAKRMIADGRAEGHRVRAAGRFRPARRPGAATRSARSDQQFDVGPKTSELFAQQGRRVHRARTAGRPARRVPQRRVRHVRGSAIREGTRRFIAQLKRMKDAGVEVYVGGGEGGTALEKYGQPDGVTHCFTAGGTVLNALGSEPVPYLVALGMASAKRSGSPSEYMLTGREDGAQQNRAPLGLFPRRFTGRPGALRHEGVHRVGHFFERGPARRRARAGRRTASAGRSRSCRRNPLPDARSRRPSQSPPSK